MKILPDLNVYLKKHALYNYSFIKRAIFEEKQNEYVLFIRKDKLPDAYPKIEFDDKKDEKPKNILFNPGINGRTRKEPVTDNSDYEPDPKKHVSHGNEVKRVSGGRTRNRRPRISENNRRSSAFKSKDAEQAVHDNNVEIARNMKKIGMSDEDISKITKLPVMWKS